MIHAITTKAKNTTPPCRPFSSLAQYMTKAQMGRLNPKQIEATAT
jgi:hypothetical protein